MLTFGLIGTGFIGQKHIDAIKKCGGEVVWTCDNFDGEADYKNYMDAIRSENDVDYISICTPNWTHFDIIQGIVQKAPSTKIICEKPLCINKDEYQKLRSFEDSGATIYTMLQYRASETLKNLRKETQEHLYDRSRPAEVSVDLFLSRDAKYFDSWKGNFEQSGGIAANLGSHYLDILMWFYGAPTWRVVDEYTDKALKAEFKLNNCWAKISIDLRATPEKQRRLFVIDDKEIDLDAINKEEQLHTKAYDQIVNKNEGIKVKDLVTFMDILDYLNDNYNQF